MNSPRDSFLERVRAAVQAGNRTAAAAPLPSRGTVGYQGAGPDPVARFREQLTAAGGQLFIAANPDAAAARAVELVRAKAARRVLLGQGAVMNQLALPSKLRAAGCEVVAVDSLAAGAARESFFGADIGITGVDYVVAETGTVALLARPGEPRSPSLLPPIHIAVAERRQLLPDLFDLFAQLERRKGAEGLPSSLVLVTGPSKTGDIELRLVTGVHGPGEVHVILIDG
jgi:L-lactate dehydrogenase complex protein LldG